MISEAKAMANLDQLKAESQSRIERQRLADLDLRVGGTYADHDGNLYTMTDYNHFDDIFWGNALDGSGRSRWSRSGVYFDGRLYFHASSASLITEAHRK